MRLLRVLMMVVAAIACTGVPASADDISAAARGVVRVVIIAQADGEELGRGHGSGFAIAPNRIVTNAHVVELANKFPSLVTIDIVPESGDAHYEGELVAFDPDADLAIIQFDGPPLPPLTLYSPSLPDGAGLVSLGYPGNVDKATMESLSQMLIPTAPVRSSGILSTHRDLRGLGTIEHTAQIARGNSGGPLLDQCGRVVGVNRAVTSADDGDGGFVMSLDENALAAFLKAQKQPFRSVDWPCTSMQAVMDAARERASRQADNNEEAARERRFQALRAQDAAVAAARAKNDATRENMMGGAALLLVLGALGVGAGGWIDSKGNRRRAIQVAAAGGAVMIGAVVLFVLRPDFDPASLDTDKGQAGGDSGAALVSGKLKCSFDPDRSRVTVSDAAPMTLDWKQGCVAGRTQYVEGADGWTRILVPDNEASVTVNHFDPASRSFTSDRYLLPRDAMARVRELRTDAELKSCTSDQAKLGELASRQSAIRAALPEQPDERLVYSCSPQ
ncbi:trypsin-like peptidase domain-containing protein [Stakelama pacifica]|uniref:Trypsin-like peptidase n=1 Tax=Stakelama pacifica TaxID=517720 RepID=A0A4R6FPL0_9SPHN|nr:trypsin-like peptidase domain-containing protein [Stakelama pacifica]TDN83606.1 trypsin-like peptidase [Stakelama pacifica]GGO94305.1 hypothetical protein GCM10011329_15790 [Stakelama pacifica]